MNKRSASNIFNLRIIDVNSKVILVPITALMASILFSSCAVNPATGGANLVLMTENREKEIGLEEHEKVIKLWMYLVDDAARKYVQEFGTQGQDVSDMFPKETRLKVAQVIADREKENIEQGEYDVTQGIVS